MDRHITLNDLLLQLLHFGFIHGLYFVVLVQIGLLEVLELPLQLLELSGYALVVLSQRLVLLLEALLGLLVLFLEGPQFVAQNSLLLGHLAFHPVVFVLLLPQHLQVVVQLLSVQLVQRFHLLEILLQLLDFRLHPDLRTRVVLSAIHSQIVNLLGEILFRLDSLQREFLLGIDVALETLVYGVHGFFDV